MGSLGRSVLVLAVLLSVALDAAAQSRRENVAEQKRKQDTASMTTRILRKALVEQFPEVALGNVRVQRVQVADQSFPNTVVAFPQDVWLVQGKLRPSKDAEQQEYKGLVAFVTVDVPKTQGPKGRVVERRSSWTLFYLEVGGTAAILKDPLIVVCEANTQVPQGLSEHKWLKEALIAIGEGDVDVKNATGPLTIQVEL